MLRTALAASLHPTAAVCGTPTELQAHERARKCPACGHAAYPRLSPAMMVLIHRGRELLLARLYAPLREQRNVLLRLAQLRQQVEVVREATRAARDALLAHHAGEFTAAQAGVAERGAHAALHEGQRGARGVGAVASGRQRVGARAQVKLNLPEQSLAQQLFFRLRQLLLRQFAQLA